MENCAQNKAFSHFNGAAVRPTNRLNRLTISQLYQILVKAVLWAQVLLYHAIDINIDV